MTTHPPGRKRILPALIAILAALPSFARAADETVPFAAASTPAAEHETLAALAGSFDLQSTYWSDPSAPPAVSKLPARREVILGGRALRLEVGPGEGGFHGSGLMGYDNVEKSFWYTWTDTTTTGVSNLTGSLDARGAGTLRGSTPTPFGATSLRVEIRFEGPEEIHEYFVPGPEGDEMKLLELHYRRSAAAR